MTLTLAALALTLTSAHVLELPQKMKYDAELYAAVNGTMNRHFATVGTAYSMGQIAAAFVLAFLLRGRGPAFAWTLAGAVLLVAWFVSWVTLVAPVNGEVAETMRSSPEAVPALWMRLRERWEYGHAFGFALQLSGFSVFLISVLVDTPKRDASIRLNPAGLK